MHTSSSARITASIPRAILTIAAAVFVALLAPHFDFVPMWDGWAYAECAMDAATNHFGLYFLRCYGHPAYAYSGLLAVTQLIDLGNPVLLFVVNGLVLAAATVGFHRLMRRAFPGQGHQIDTALLTAAFLLQPAFVASVLQPALDLPVLAGTIWCAVLLIERRPFWCAVVGTAMAFSKETGVLLYAALLACAFIWLVTRDRDALATRLRTFLPTVAPLVAYAGYVIAFRVFRPGQDAVWETNDQQSVVSQALLPRMDAELANYLALVCVLNFAWLATIAVATDAGVGAVRVVRRQPPRVVAGGDRSAIGFLTLVAVATLIALTRFTTFGNVRYLLAGTGLLLAIAYFAIARLGLRPSARRIALGGYLVALVVSTVRTVDPVSRRTWGTFAFGSHRMLDMTSITGECCGAGRDQLVYSLEFTRFHDLLDSVLTTLVRDTTTVIAFPSDMRYLAVGRIDRTTWRRTLRRNGAFEPTMTEGPDSLSRAAAPQSAIYIAMPNAKDSTTLAVLSNRFAVGPERRFESGGYVLSAHELTLASGNKVLSRARERSESSPTTLRR